jgi:preprotein translocase SecF subunit
MINFLRFNKFFAFLSIVLIIFSIGLIYWKGFNYGIDFKGGTLIQIYRNHEDGILNEQIESLRNHFHESGFQIFIQKFSGDEKRLILKIADKNSKASTDFDKFKFIINENFPDSNNIVFERIEFIGAKTGEGFFIKSAIAVILAFLGIFLYLLWRFNLKFTLSALIALFHDIILSFGFISLFGIEFNLIFITAILTIIGYSINDSVIIFDRIREIIKTKGESIDSKETINLALNNTIRRTLFTSLTTLFACFSLIIFGGRDLFSFSVPVVFGIIVGTYSSIFIACQIVLLFNNYIKF